MAVRALLLALLGLVLHLAGCAAGARVSFPNVAQSDAVAGSATLVTPEGPGPFPAVVLLHGCSGVRPNAYQWADLLKAHGYASLILDSFGPRRVGEICTKFSRVSVSQRVLDAYSALRFLGARRDIDPTRIALMGFSHGGGAALDAVESDWVRRMSDTGLRFQASIALYPSCQGRDASQPNYRAPVMILIGDRDDWTPASSCERLARGLDDDSARLELRVYPGAMHSFDDLTAGGRLPFVRNPNSPSGYGASVGGDARSLARARVEVLEFLKPLETVGNMR
ncbi:MAG: dienelactone hydrolase family protein [Betaproteobacteria bacterium]|nr:dienelactone hydrolase family protein [Betaproteobacteria bacterium]